MADGTTCGGGPEPVDDRGWPDPATAERLLCGAPADPADPREERVGALLRLLEASGRRGGVDPEREQVALVAFRAAHRERERGPGRRIVGSARSVRALAGGLVVAFTIGGVAVAAGVGALPAPFRGGAVHAGPLTTQPPRTSAGPVPLTTAPPPGDGSSGRTPEATPTQRSSAPAAEGREKRALREMRRSYARAVRQDGHVDGQVDDRLRRAAGRKERIRDYCRELLAGPEGRDSGRRSGEGKSGSGKADDGKSGSGKSDDAKSSSGKPGSGKPGDDGKPGDANSGSGKPGDPEPGSGKSGDVKPGSSKSGDGTSDSGKSGPGESGDGTSRHGAEHVKRS